MIFIKNLMFALGLACAPTVHDIHISVVEFDFYPNRIELTVKTFLDDLQLAVGLVPGQELPKDYTSSDELIITYLKKSIQVSINDEDQEYIISDISAASDAVWISIDMEVPALDSLNKIEIENTFLTELYDDQKNIIKFNLNDKKETELLDVKKTHFSLSF